MAPRPAQGLINPAHHVIHMTEDAPRIPLPGWTEYPPEDMLARARSFAEEMSRRRTVRDFSERAVPRELIEQALRAAGLGACTHAIGGTNTADELRIWRNAKSVFAAKRSDLQQAWSEVSFQIASLRDDPTCAREEFDALADAGNPGADDCKVWIGVHGRSGRKGGVGHELEYTLFVLDKIGLAS